MPKPTPLERLMARVTVTPGPLATACWITSAADNGHGYALMKDEGRMWYCHRLAYTLLVGPIPEGMTLDHLCRVTRCVNPDHLEAVTQGVNTLRGHSEAAMAKRTGLCKRGHSLDDAYVRPNGARACRTCHKLYGAGLLTDVHRHRRETC